jgi:3-oxoacyl-[acyl-carrier protein] reductase
MERTLADRTAIVTGGSRGIGKVIARRLAMDGAQTVICSRSQEQIESAADDIKQELSDNSTGRIYPVECDVTSASDVRELVDVTLAEFNRVDALVNNAGGSISNDGKLHTVDEQTWADNLTSNLTSSYLCSREVIPPMAENGGGSIVHLSSANGFFGIGSAAYSAAKAGLLSLSQNIAVHYGAFSIRSNVLSPGTIMTEDRQERMSNPPTDTHQELRDEYPLDRFGWPEEVAEAALFLASPRGSFVTGANVPVDGGLTTGLSQTFHRAVSNIEDQPERGEY